MLRIGLTGGIGSGKSTVARRLVARGAVLVDSDVLAREVLAPGTEGLAAVVAAFGERVRGPDGGLDRPALAALVFADADARRRLNAIVHPRVRERSAGLVAAAASDAIVVQDVPLLVETGMAPMFPLVVVVHAAADERVRRLVRDRGVTETDARARIAAQAGDAARRAAADVWLDNTGPPEALDVAVDALWDGRLLPFEENLRLRRVAAVEPRWVAARPDWPAQAARLAARLSAAADGAPVEHVGPTAAPGLPAPDVIELLVGARPSRALAAALAAAGFPRRGQRFGAADPGRAVDIRVCPPTSGDWRSALAARDRLRADGEARTEYLVGARDVGAPADVTGWLGEIRSRVGAWAATRGCRSSLIQGHP